MASLQWWYSSIIVAFLWLLVEYQLYQLPRPALAYDCIQSFHLNCNHFSTPLKPACVIFPELLVDLRSNTAYMRLYVLYSYIVSLFNFHESF